jgi:hypothetical protein
VHQEITKYMIAYGRKERKENYQHFLLYTESATRCEEVLENHLQTRSGYCRHLDN